MAKKVTTTVKFIVTDFPQGTTEMYLVGSADAIGAWEASKSIQMQYYQNEGTDEMFIATVELPKNSEVEYKYLNHPSWDNVECGFVAEDLPNRTLTLKTTNSREVEDTVKGFRI